MAKIQDLIKLEMDLHGKKKEVLEKYQKKMQAMDNLADEELGKMNEKMSNRSTIIEEEVGKMTKDTDKEGSKHVSVKIDPKKKEHAKSMIEKAFLSLVK